MRFSANRFIAIRKRALILCGLALGASSAQSQIQKLQNSDATTQVHRANAKRHAAPAGLSPDDGLSVIAAALDSQVQAARERDCSHLVHAIYLRAGFPYSYASSTELYEGAEGFLRVTRPQPGDLVVWPGHVGVVVNPAQHLFFSRLRRGPGVEAYDAPYWKERGQAKFYRYIKTAPAHVPTTHLVTSRQHK
jgi:cell wall-associated NlpC family hydrolase